ncbi:ABC transporter permease [Sphaerisporangium aureirubrum]|uniref:Transport permease protein n=1 Tax=Sphaerisporangium aureirubrum TaxID=1544736 RepID=A0ABW1NR38_9ACTN
MTTSAAVSPAAAPQVRVYPLRDLSTMLRRNIKNQLRDKVAVGAIIGIPVLFLLLFNYVFGGALGDTVKAGGSGSYVNYLLPGLIIMTAASQLIGTSTLTSVDMTGGIFNRFRTMAIYTPSILVARVLSSVIQALLSMAVVIGIAFLMGLSPTATFLEWLAILGFLAYVSFTLCWLGLAFGLAAKSVGSASNGPFPLVLLPLVGSGIVPPESMSAGVRWFAEYQPFTPMIDTLRGLMFGTPVGNSAIIALVWSTGFGVLGLFWSLKAFNRERPDRPS